MTWNELLTAANFAWPVSWRWHIQAPWGVYTQVLTVDAPELQDNPTKSRALGKVLYMGSVAQATTRATAPFFQETVCWKMSDLPFADFLNTQQGWRWGSAAPRERSAVIVMHTGHDDGRARRRWFLGGMPADWQADGLLTLEGAEELQTVARSMVMGMIAGGGGRPLQWLLAYPEAIPGDGLVPPQVGFRMVSHLRVCQYTERVPSLSSELWPSAD